MKIIGKTKYGFILECGKNEVANMAGDYNLNWNNESMLDIGTEINVSWLYRQAKNVGELHQELTHLAKKFRLLAEGIDYTTEFVKAKTGEKDEPK